MGSHIRVAHLDMFAEANLVAAQVEGVELVVVNRADTVTVFEGRCPHQGTLLAEGSLEDDALICRGHGWRFHCASGAKVDDAGVCLHQFAAHVDADGQVCVDREEVLAWRDRDAETDTAQSDRFPSRSLQDMPGPKGWPLVGNSLQLHMRQFHRDLEQWAETYGPMYTFRIGRKPVLVVTEPTLVNDIMRQRPDGFRRLNTIEPVLQEIGVNGVFSAEGANWRRQRQLVMQALDTKHLRQFFPALRTVTERLQHRWEHAAATQACVDVQKDLMRYTVDVTTNLAFGYDMNTLEQEDDVVQHHLEKIFPMISRRIFAPFPYWRYVKLPSDRALDKALVEVRKVITGFITHSREQLAQHPALAQHPTNLLEAMLAARDEGDAQFSEDEIFGNVFTMLLAGEDTTANTLAWVMHFMTEHPDVQRKMQAEADAVLGATTVLDDYHDARKLDYIEAVAHETMRLKPVAPLLGFETNRAVTVGGVQLPPEASVIVLQRPSVLDERNFPQALSFNPDRWLSSDDSRNVAHHKGFIPFGSGPRLCPGRSLALLEMQTALAMVCRNFDLAKVPQTQPVGELFAFTMMPTNLAVTFSPR